MALYVRVPIPSSSWCFSRCCVFKPGQLAEITKHEPHSSISESVGLEGKPEHLSSKKSSDDDTKTTTSPFGFVLSIPRPAKGPGPQGTVSFPLFGFSEALSSSLWGFSAFSSEISVFGGGVIFLTEGRAALSALSGSIASR